jgi:hypothetical protein
VYGTSSRSSRVSIQEYAYTHLGGTIMESRYGSIECFCLGDVLVRRGCVACGRAKTLKTPVIALLRAQSGKYGPIFIPSIRPRFVSWSHKGRSSL